MGYLRAALVGATASLLVTLLLLSTAHARADERAPQSFDIRPQALAAALSEFARQSHEEILYAPDIVAEKHSGGVRGTMQPLAALKVLLNDSGLPFTSTPSGAILIGQVGNSPVVSTDEASDSAQKEGKKSSSHDFRVAQVDQGKNSGLASVANQSSSSQENSNSPSGALAEIVVTAQKREERLIDVPQSVSVLSSDTLAKLGAVQFSDYASTVPGLSFKTGGAGYNQISLRGVTTGTEASPTVGIYVDEVPFGSSTAFAFAARFALDMGLFDVDRIEVLRGPQGTLYGASSMGGLIKYVTKQPDPSSFGVDVQTGVSDTHDGGVNYITSLVVNAPIVADVATLRASVFESHDGGYIDNVELGQKDVNHSNVYGSRASLLVTPTDGLTINISGFVQNISRKGESTADYNFAGVPLVGDLEQRRGFAETFDQHFRLVSGTVTYDLNVATLTSISSYQTVRSEWIDDLSGEFVPLVASIGLGSYGAIADSIDLNTNKFTQEVRLASKEKGPVEWIVGGFYTHETSCDCEDFVTKDPAGQVVPNTLLLFALPTRYQEYAAFGDLTWHLSSKFDVTGGVRDAHNSQVFTQYASGAFGANSPTIRSNENVLTYLANASYHVSDHATAYLRYATGYRPGGPAIVERDPSTGLPLGPTTFGADRLKSYEIGIKAETPDRRFGIDAATYYIDWANIQLSTSVGGFGTFTNASGPAHIEGAELSLNARPVRDLTLTGAFAYQHAYLTEADKILGAAGGERLPNSPRYSGSLSADDVLIEEGLRPTIGATVRYVSDRTASFDHDGSFPQYRLPAYTALDLRSGLVLGGAGAHPVNLQLFVHNVFDERGQLAAQTQFGKAQVTILQPRTIGINATAHF